MTVWTEPTVCELCGNSRGGEIAIRLIRWRDAEPGMSYDHIHRCVDNAACRSRVEGTGREWPEERMERTA